MTDSATRNVAASVRQRLLNYSRETGQEFQHVLTRYALERLLYRISQSSVRESLLLKGAMLFQVWSGQLHRPTRDLDLLGFGESSHERFAKVFADICRLNVEPDGLAFDADSVRVEDIREDVEYSGIRVKLRATLAGARLKLQIDIGFGDAVTPGPVDTAYPTLLDFPAPVIRAYPRETVVAEKLQAMVMLGIANSRMKDFYDVWTLSRLFDFRGETLTDDFATDSAKQTQWSAFVRKGRFDDCPADLLQIVEPLREFLLPPLSALTAETRFARNWPSTGPWLE